MTFDLWHATNTEYFDSLIFVFKLILNLDFMVTFFNVITCLFRKTNAYNKPYSIILFTNENIAIFVKLTLTLIQGQGEEIGYNLLQTVC
jgi:hypothetical protein